MRNELKGKSTRFLLMWPLFTAVYLLITGGFEKEEIVAGAVAGLGAAFLSLGLGVQFDRTVLLKPRWLILLLRIPWAMLAETWLLMTALLRKLGGEDVRGKFITVPCAAGRNDLHGAALEAYMTFGICITPNSYLVYYDQKTGQALIRQLAGKKLSRLDRIFAELR